MQLQFHFRLQQSHSKGCTVTGTSQVIYTKRRWTSVTFVQIIRINLRSYLRSYLWWKLTAVLYDKISTKLKNRKTQQCALLVLFLGSGYFLFRWNILGTVDHVTGRCLVKFSEGPTVTLGTHNTTFSLCSWSPYHFIKFKCTARILRRSTNVLFTLPQLSWQPNPFVMCALFCPQGVAVVVSRPVSFLREVTPGSKARASNSSDFK